MEYLIDQDYLRIYLFIPHLRKDSSFQKDIVQMMGPIKTKFKTGQIGDTLKINRYCMHATTKKFLKFIK